MTDPTPPAPPPHAHSFGSLVLTPVTKQITQYLVDINGVQYERSELLGYVEGLKNATEAKPMPIYNDSILTQLIVDGFAKLAPLSDAQIEDMKKFGVKPKHVICINEQGRALFEAEIRALDFGV